MAGFGFKAGDEYSLKLSKLKTDSDEIAKKAIYEGAKIVADKIKENLEGVLSEKATGELMESFGIAGIDTDRNGDWNTKIGFDGYDSQGIPNQLKARILESGSSIQPKTPFVRPAIKATKKKAKEKMGQIIEEECSKRMK